MRVMCNATEPCTEANTECIDDMCTCMAGYVPSEGVCVEGIYKYNVYIWPKICFYVNYWLSI